MKVLNKKQILKREIKFYNRIISTPDNIRKKISKRKNKIRAEYEFNMPQSLFVINNEKTNLKIFGRKAISKDFIEGKLMSINSSYIDESMLLGVFKSYEYKNKKITIKYSPISKKEKKYFFNKIKNDLRYNEIIFPFQYKHYDSGEEQLSSEIKWYADKRLIKNLNFGERYQRHYTCNLLKKMNINPQIAYDPACSTGCFLFNVKKHFNKCITIGHDLSPSMVEHSKKYVDFSLCCDALQSPLPNNSVDLLILRFLNGGIVAKSEVTKYLDCLLPKLKPNGYIICIGHTPVLLTKEIFKNYGLIIKQSIGCTSKYIFQFYFLQKIK